MKFVSTEELGLAPKTIWQTTDSDQEIVITTNGRPVAILTGVDETTFEQEIEAIRRARALRALDLIHKESVERGTHLLSEEEIQAEIDAVRKENRA